MGGKKSDTIVGISFLIISIVFFFNSFFTYNVPNFPITPFYDLFYLIFSLILIIYSILLIFKKKIDKSEKVNFALGCFSLFIGILLFLNCIFTYILPISLRQMFNVSYLIISLNVIIWSVLFLCEKNIENNSIDRLLHFFIKRKYFFLILTIYFVLIFPQIFFSKDINLSIIRVLPIFPIYIFLAIASIFQIDLLYFLAILIGAPLTIWFWTWIINKFFVNIKNVPKKNQIFEELEEIDDFFIQSKEELGFVSKILSFIKIKYVFCLIILFFLAYFSRLIFFYDNFPGNDTPHYLYYSKVIYNGDWETYFSQDRMLNLISYLPINSTLAFFILLFNGNVFMVLTYVIPLFTSFISIALAITTFLIFKSKILSIFASLIYIPLIWQTHMGIENLAQLFSILCFLIGIIVRMSNKIENLTMKRGVYYFFFIIGAIYYFSLILIFLIIYILFIRLEIGNLIHDRIKKSMKIFKNENYLKIFYLSIITVTCAFYFLIIEIPIVNNSPLVDIYYISYDLFLRYYSLFETLPIWWIIVNNIPFLIIAPFGLIIWYKYFRFNVIVNISLIIVFYFFSFEFFGIISTSVYFAPRILYYLEFALIIFAGMFFLKYWKKIIRIKHYPKFLKKIFPFLVLTPLIIGFIAQIPYNSRTNFDQSAVEMLDWLIDYDPSLLNDNRSDNIIITNYKSEYWMTLQRGEQLFSPLAYQRTFHGLYGTYSSNTTRIAEDLIENNINRLYIFINEMYEGYYTKTSIRSLLEEFESRGYNNKVIYGSNTSVTNLIIQIDFQ